MVSNLGLTLVQFLVPSSKHDIKCPNAMRPQYITIHNTANDASATAEISYMIGNNNEVSYHWAVDEIQAINAIPHNRNGWHCGDGLGTGNLTSIGIEICHSLTPGNPRYAQSEENGAKLAAIILHDLGWGIDRIRKHQDWSGKYCPHRILDNSNWDGFKAKVQNYLNQLNGATAQQTPTTKQTEDKDMTITFVRFEEDINAKIKKGNIYLFNAGARTYHHLTPVEYDAAKAAYPQAIMLKATKTANYLSALAGALGAKEI